MCACDEAGLCGSYLMRICTYEYRQGLPWVYKGLKAFVVYTTLINPCELRELFTLLCAVSRSQ